MEETHKEHTNTASLPALVPDNGGSSSNTKEKHNDSGTSSEDVTDDKVEVCMQVLDEDAKPEYRNGVPVIKTGLDVSRFVVDIRDDGDEALTFRSILLGTAFGCMGAALYQVNAHPHYLRSNDFAMVISAHRFPPLHTSRRTITRIFLSYNVVFHAVQRREPNAHYFLPDLRFQTYAAAICVQGIFTPRCISRWDRACEVLPSTHLGRWHSVWATGACIPLH